MGIFATSLINPSGGRTPRVWRQARIGRFSKWEMGDWQFGRHYKPGFKLAEAVAASAAFPYAIGALEFGLPLDEWFRTDPATRQPIERIIPSCARVRLWDGGAYENWAWRRCTNRARACGDAIS